MNNRDTIDALNQLLAIHYRSVPMYLTEAVPWTHHGDEQATAAVEDIVASHKAIVVRLADEIQNRYGVVDPGDFPAEYTDLHFLSLDYLLIEILAGLDLDIQSIQECVRRLEDDRVGKALAEEALGNARGHRQTIEELLRPVAGRTVQT
ncbi:MAG: hypothetical protein K8T91_16720 [Planctomycetes bacterium]|nr:hypothetical protein [Planctomycetota bacterium]